MSILAGLTLATLVACDMTERATPTVVDRIDLKEKDGFRIDVDPIMRGTIASETIVTGYQPLVARGYGLVVDLPGTGSRIAPAPIRAQVIADLARMGFGTDGSGTLPGPEEVVDSNTTAIVAVEGIVPPGAVKGSTFDVRVYVVPGTSTQSLDGGKLAYVDLRPGPFRVGSEQSKLVASAKGPLVINPFANNRDPNSNSVDRLTARILNGGVISEDLPVRLRLATPSHNRSKVIEAAVNSTFPREAGQREPTARGRTDEVVDISIPPSWEDRTDEFVQLLRHAPVQLADNDRMAVSIQKALLANPGAAEAARWRWQALGKQALPAIRELYDYPEEQPRFAALTAGAGLGDPLVVQPLEKMAREADRSLRIKAIELLGSMGPNTSIDIALRPFLDDDDIDIRLEAYEALANRRDPLIFRYTVDGKYELDIVPSDDALIYITQTGIPRVAIFGGETQVTIPMTIHDWDGRLIMRGDLGEDRFLVRHRPANGGPAEQIMVAPFLPELAYALGHGESGDATPHGLDMSYSDVVAALHSLWKAGYANADFKAQQDRFLAELNRTDPLTRHGPRPDFADERTVLPGADVLAGIDSEEVDPLKAEAYRPEDGQRPDQVVPR
ncbi:MAG: flagellar basal body P-ring protein FlgI [Planctomycetota bacterium]|nr:flagellar basal body P-ring protein FlgI [Planctomycetota bacterium]